MSGLPTGSRQASAAFVARGAELEMLRALLDRAAAGEGGLALIEGEAGIGKTRLVAEALEPAEARGTQVFRGAGDDLERDRPFRLIADAFGLDPDATDRRRAEIARLLLGRPEELVSSPRQPWI